MMQTAIFNLTHQKEECHIQVGPFPDEFDQKPLNSSNLEISEKLNEVKIKDLANHQVFIFLEPTPARTAASMMILAGLLQGGITPQIIIKNGGDHLHLDNFLDNGYDWAMRDWFAAKEENCASWLEIVPEEV